MQRSRTKNQTQVFELRFLFGLGERGVAELKRQLRGYQRLNGLVVQKQSNSWMCARVFVSVTDRVRVMSMTEKIVPDIETTKNVTTSSSKPELCNNGG